MQPCAQRFRRMPVLGQLFGEVAEMVHLMAINRLEQGLARREMPVERADADACLTRNRFQARLRAAGAEDLRRRFEQKLAVADRIGARLRWVLAVSGSHCLAGVAHCLLLNGGTLRI